MAPLLASSLRHEKITLEPKEKPTKVMGRTPKFLSINESARIKPAEFARSRDTVQGLSIRYASFVNTIGSCSEAIRATSMVLPRTCCKP